MRALGHGLRVHIIYFMKGEYPYGEQKILSQLPNITFARFGFESFVDPMNIKEEEKEQARQALKAAHDALLSGKYDLLVLDEVNIAAAWGLVEVDDVVNLIKDKPYNLELILTGRYADVKLTDRANLTSKVEEVKHPYKKGVRSRKGIDY